MVLCLNLSFVYRGMVMAFEWSLSKLSELRGLQGAAIVNFRSGTILAKVEQGGINLDKAVDGLVEMMTIEQQLLLELGCRDLLDSIATLTDDNHHIINVVPYFDNVLLYVVASRKNPLALVNHTIAEAIDSMV